MALSSHIHALQEKHATLSAEIEKAQQHPSLDDLELVEMKKQKLRIKEEISKLSA